MKQTALLVIGLLFISGQLIGTLPGVSPAGHPARTDDSTAVTEFLGAIIRGDPAVKKIALVFTGDEFGDGLPAVIRVLKAERMQASFFLTGNFYRNAAFDVHITDLRNLGNYLGSHSDKHLLYCDWGNRDSLLVSRETFEKDLNDSYQALSVFGVDKKQAPYFLPPYEWYNDTIASWTRDMGLQLVNFTPGTRSTADYTYPEMKERYVDNQTIMASILDYERTADSGLNGFILLSHIGTDPRRKEKFYDELPILIRTLKNKGYRFVRIDELLPPRPVR